MIESQIAVETPHAGRAGLPTGSFPALGSGSGPPVVFGSSPPPGLLKFEDVPSPSLRLSSGDRHEGFFYGPGILKSPWLLFYRTSLDLNLSGFQ